jgi:hypothetical protein
LWEESRPSIGAEGIPGIESVGVLPLHLMGDHRFKDRKDVDFDWWCFEI